MSIKIHHRPETEFIPTAKRTKKSVWVALCDDNDLPVMSLISRGFRINKYLELPDQQKLSEPVWRRTFIVVQPKGSRTPTDTFLATSVTWSMLSLLTNKWDKSPSVLSHFPPTFPPPPNKKINSIISKRIN